MIALNLQHLSFAELAGRLDYGQIAPIGWIYLHKALWELTHNLELGLEAAPVRQRARDAGPVPRPGVPRARPLRRPGGDRADLPVLAAGDLRRQRQTLRGRHPS